MSTMPGDPIAAPPLMPTVPSRERRLPATQTDLIQFLMRRISQGEATAILEFSGRLDADRLREAIVSALTVEPILSCRFVDHWYRPYWQTVDAAQVDKAFQVIESESPPVAIQKFLFETINPEIGPQFRTMLIRGPECDTLLLKMCHQCCDGPSFKNYVYWLFRLYNRNPEEPLDPKRDPASPHPSYDRSLVQIARRIRFSQKWRILRRFVKNASSPLTWRFPRPVEGSSRRCIQELTLEPELTSRINVYGRERKTSLTVLLVAAFHLAARRVAEPADSVVKVGITADLRRLFLFNVPKHPGTQSPTPMSNLSGPNKFTLEAGREYTFEEAVEQIRDQFQEILAQRMIGVEYPPLILSFGGFRHLARLIPFQVMRRRFSKRIGSLANCDRQHCSLANLGDFDPRRLAAGGVEVSEMSVTGPIYEQLGMAPLVTTYRDRIHIAVGFTESLIDQTTAARFLTAIANELLCQPSSEELPPGATLQIWNESTAHVEGSG